jgi:hypothetical protein
MTRPRVHVAHTPPLSSPLLSLVSSSLSFYIHAHTNTHTGNSPSGKTQVAPLFHTQATPYAHTLAGATHSVAAVTHTHSHSRTQVVLVNRGADPWCRNKQGHSMLTLFPKHEAKDMRALLKPVRTVRISHAHCNHSACTVCDHFVQCLQLLCSLPSLLFFLLHRSLCS